MAIVVISAGQSNCEGGTYYQASANGQNGEYSRSYIWHKDRTSQLLDGQWQKLHFDTCNTSFYGGAARAAYELEMATQLEAIYPEENIYIIKVAIGGTGLDAATLDPQWSPGGELRTALIDHYALPALNSLAAQGVTPKVTMVWSQGEADASSSSIAARYYSNCKSLFSEVRRELNMPQLPIFVIRMASTHIHDYVGTIMAAQDAIAAEDKHVFLMNTDGLPKDSVGSSHYTTFGYQIQGRAIARKISDGFWTEYKPRSLHDIAGLKGTGWMWLDQSDLSGGSVVQWKNRFGTYGVVQGNAPQQPNHSVDRVQFRRSNASHMDITSSSVGRFQALTQNMVIFIAGTFATGGDGATILDISDNSYGDRVVLQTIREDGGTRKIGYLTDTNSWQLTTINSEITDLLGQHCVLEYVLDDTASSDGRLFINGKLFLSGSYTPRKIGNRVCLGARWDNFYFLEGDVTAFALFRATNGQQVMSDAERAAVRTALFYKL